MSISRREFLSRSAGVTLSAGVGLPLFGAGEKAEKSKAPKPDPYADAKFLDGPPPMPSDGSFTVAVLPDTQFYSEKYPANYHAQTDWVANSVKDRRIAAVLHLGDITNNTTPPEWKVASEAMARLDGRVPYFMVVGNHDYGPGQRVGRATPVNEAFPVARFKAQSEFGGAYDREPDRMENTFHRFQAGGRKFLVLALEYGPRNDVLRWANEIATTYADHEAILITHAYMYYDETRYDFAKYGSQQRWNPAHSAISRDDANDGEGMWRKLVGRHENFILTLNGHVLEDGLARLTSQTSAGRDVHQLLVNFQMKPHGGDGWLRLLEFKPDGRTVEVYDYSPTLDRQNVSVQNRMTLATSPVKV